MPVIGLAGLAAHVGMQAAQHPPQRSRQRSVGRRHGHDRRWSVQRGTQGGAASLRTPTEPCHLVLDGRGLDQVRRLSCGAAACHQHAAHPRGLDAKLRLQAAQLKRAELLDVALLEQVRLGLSAQLALDQPGELRAQALEAAYAGEVFVETVAGCGHGLLLSRMEQPQLYGGWCLRT